MEMSYDSVRAIWRHWEKHGKLAPNYEACRQTGPRQPQAVVERAIQMKREHPRWGAGLIRLLLSDEFEEDELPSERTLQRWFRQAGVGRTPSTKQSHSPVIKRGQAVHDVWAIDAKEKMTLGDGNPASWLTISDEASGAILAAEAFPPQKLESDRPTTGASVSTSHDGPLGKAEDDAV
jgi:hypothetical protein